MARAAVAAPRAAPTCPNAPSVPSRTADGVTEITLWHAWVGLTKRTVESIAEDYNASQDKVKVNVESQGNYEEMLAKYESALADPRVVARHDPQRGHHHAVHDRLPDGAAGTVVHRRRS